MKIEKTFWFSTNWPTVIGIVLGVDELTGEKKGYIGFVSGSDEEADKLTIAQTGQKIEPAILKEASDYLTPVKK